MSEKINLATFELDTARLETSLGKLQDSMFKLRKEQEGYSNQSKEAQKAINDLVKSQLALAASGKEDTVQFKENKKAIEDLNIVQQQLYKNQQNVANNMSRVRQEVTQTNTQLRAYMGSEAEQITLSEASNRALQTQVTNINQARASNTELLRVRNQLNPAIAEEAKLITSLNEKMNENNKFIKTNASEYEKQKIGIGGYTDSIKTAIRESGLMSNTLNQLGPAGKVAEIGFKTIRAAVDDVKDTFKNYKQSQDEVSKAQENYKSLSSIATEATEKSKAAQETASAIGFKYAAGQATLAESQAATAVATAATTTATQAQTAATAGAVVVTNASSVALKLFRIALISTGIGAIVVALSSLVAFLTQTQKGIDLVTSVTRPLQAVFSAMVGVLSNLGAKLVETFSNPKKAITDLADLIKNNLINRVKGAIDLIKNLANLDFSAAGESLTQTVTGIDDLGGKIKKTAGEAAKFLADNIKKGTEIDRISKQITKSQLEYNAAQVAVNDEIDKQLLISKDTSKSFAERGKAAEAIIALNEKNGQQEKAILELELKRLKIQQSIRGVQNLTNEDRQEEIDIMNKIDAAEDRGLEARLEQSRVLSGLKKEQAEASRKGAEDEIKNAKAIQDAGIKAMQNELDYYLASQGEKKRSMADQLAIDKETMRLSLDIAKAEANAAKKNADNEIKNKQERALAKANIEREYQIKELEIQNEFAAKQVEATISNAELELEMFMLNNQRKIDENKYFSDEIYNEELNRINRIAEAEAAALTTKFVNGQISLKEYNLAIAQIDEDQRIQNEAAALEREEAQKEKDDLDLINKIIADAENFDYNLSLQLEQFDRQYAVEKAAAIAAGADMVAFEKAQAEKRMKIEANVQNNRLDLASATFANLATILGKESAAGKAAAIAQATIDTYKGATSAYASLATIVPVGPALGVIAAAAAVASGLANVKKIVSTKEVKLDAAPRPKYASGGYITGAGSSKSDNVDARLSTGESVINARSTAMFPQLLSQINQVGGGVSFDGIPTANNVLQNSISDKADMSQSAEIIANAVYMAAALGTAEGSAKGITGLSDNRQIMSDAKF